MYRTERRKCIAINLVSRTIGNQIKSETLALDKPLLNQ